MRKLLIVFVLLIVGTVTGPKAGTFCTTDTGNQIAETLNANTVNWTTGTNPNI